MLFDFSNNWNTNLWMPKNKLPTNYLTLCSSERPSETSHHINYVCIISGSDHNLSCWIFFFLFVSELSEKWKKKKKKKTRPNIRILHPSEYRHTIVWTTRHYLYIFPAGWIFILSGGGSIVIIWIPYSNKSDKRPSLRGSNKISQTIVPVYL